MTLHKLIGKNISEVKYSVIIQSKHTLMANKLMMSGVVIEHGSN